MNRIIAIYIGEPMEFEGGTFLSYGMTGEFQRGIQKEFGVFMPHGQNDGIWVDAETELYFPR